MDTILENAYVFLRYPNDSTKPVEVKPNTIIDLGKLGSFSSNLLIGRPYYHTYELLEKREGEVQSRLRIVPAADLLAEAGLDDDDDGTSNAVIPEGYDLQGLGEGSGQVMKDNRLTVDHAGRQALSQADIEELKKTADGKEIIEKILAGHAGLDEKTEFSKAKYMLRKHKKYLKRFTVLPVDLGHLAEHFLEKEPGRIMEMREETLGLITAWSNAHYSGLDGLDAIQIEKCTGRGNWLCVDDTGGLVVAALAERMNILHLSQSDREPPSSLAQHTVQEHSKDTSKDDDVVMEDSSKPTKAHRDYPLPETTNTITLLHPAVQPNVSMLKYFHYDTSNPNLGSQVPEHPLHTHLKSLSWLQLLHPQEDPTYQQPEDVTEAILNTWKSGKRGTYYKKRRRWERCRAIVDSTKQGGFEGLVIATFMELSTVLQHTIPLLRGGANIVVYSPTIEPLVALMDLYSKERRTAYIAHLSRGETPDIEDFPLDPRLLLGANLQSSRIRDYQVLPGRTHPLMTSRGGAEGYVFTARRVIPLEGGVEARGNFTARAKKRKLDDGQEAGSPLQISSETANGS